MRHICISLLAALALCAGAPVFAADDAGAFERVKTKTFDNEKFVFPEDVRGKRLNVLFLAMAADDENGKYQQQALLAWQAALDERSVFSADVVAYHFPALSGPPFFVKGMIRRAMRDVYDGVFPLDQAGVLFVDDLDEFAASARLELDERPTIVIASADAVPLQTFKGEVSPEGADEVAAAIAVLLVEPAD